MRGPVFSPRLVAVRDLAPAVRLFRFASPPGFSFTPGQFLMFHFADDPKTWRAYSLCSSPSKAGEFFEVAVGMVGAFSDRLGALRPGDESGLVVRGAFGKWTYDGSAPHAVLVSGGTGITPFRAMCRLKADGGAAGRLTVCYSAKTPADLLFRDEYGLWTEAGIAVHPRVTRADAAAGWDGAVGRWTAGEVLAASGDPAAEYYLCGPKKMVEELAAALHARGAERVRTEKWGDYADLI